MQIRIVSNTDASPIAEIYNHYIKTSHSTFEVEPVDAVEMLRRINGGRAGGHPFFVAEEDGEIVGYAYGRQFRPRAGYRHSIEISVYIRQGYEGKSIGTRLYEQLFSEINNGDFHAVIAGISLPNDASTRLHEKFGMVKVAHFREVGYKFGRWIDVGYWELLLAKSLPI